MKSVIRSICNISQCDKEAMKSDLLEYLLIFSTLLHLWFILSTLQRRRNAVSPRSPSTELLKSMGRLLITTVYPGIFDAETLPEPAPGLDGDLYLCPSVLVITYFNFFLSKIVHTVNVEFFLKCY